MERPSIGIIGQGHVGAALQRGLEKQGYAVRTAGHEPDQVREVGAWGEVLVLAVPYGERTNAIAELGDTFQGKTIVDVTNALDREMRFQGSTDKSGAEDLQDMVGSACVVKAFNTVFADQMDKGRAEAGPLSIFVASDDDEAKQEVARMGEEIGFEVVDAGPLAAARWLEPLGYLNIHLAMNTPMGSGGGFRFQQPRARSAKGRPRRASRATQAARKPAKATEAAQSSRNRR